jgi:hypothetical protein
MFASSTVDDDDDDEEDDEDEDDVAAAVSSDDEPHAASMAGANASARGEENARTKERWAGRMLERAEEPKQNPASIVDLSAAPSRRARSGGTREDTMGAQWKQKGREAAANAKGRIMTRLSRELMIAARDGADPTMNPRLRMAVEAAGRGDLNASKDERAALNERVDVVTEAREREHWRDFGAHSTFKSMSPFQARTLILSGLSSLGTDSYLPPAASTRS